MTAYINFDLRDFNRNCTFILPFQYENYIMYDMINKYVENKKKRKIEKGKKKSIKISIF